MTKSFLERKKILVYQRQKEFETKEKEDEIEKDDAGISASSSRRNNDDDNNYAGINASNSNSNNAVSKISHSRFLNAIEMSAEGLSVLRKLHEQVSDYREY